ncbi:peroxiredoxin [soil metagenome]
MTLVVGKLAPVFHLVDTEKQIITNETIAGQTTLFLFFPFAFTGTCTKELCGVRDDLERYNSMQVRVIGVSVDSIYALAKYKTEQELNFTLASDFNKDMSISFDTMYETFAGWMKGVSKRSAFIIDAKGVIQYVEVLENAGEIPDFDAIHEKLNAMMISK